ncbi:MAG: MlaD family protein [Stackebrandtia sp.]
MVTRKQRVQIGIFALISLLGISFVGVNYLGWFDRSYSVYVDAPDTGGAYEHGAVAYRGVPVGRVGDVEVRDGGARIELLIESAVEIPADVAVVVAQRSAVGEQYVDLRPNTAAGPYLADGDVLDKEVTLPLPMGTLLSNLDKLLESLDPDDLAVVVDELGAAFEGNEDALERLLEASQAVVGDSLEHLPETLELIRNSETVLQTQISSADSIQTWAAELAKLTETISDSDADIRDLIKVAPEAADQVSGLLQDLDPSLGPLLGNLITVNGVVYRRLPSLETALVTFPMVVSGSFTVTPGDGTAHFGLALNFDNPPPCVYGDSGDLVCSEQEVSQGSAVRGWHNAPGPTGPEVVPVPLTPSGDDSGGGDSDDGADSGSDDDGTLSDFGYDPLTGLIVDMEGNPVRFRANGGQDQLAGDQSWKQLILAGVTS